MIKNYPTLKKLVPLFFLLYSFNAFSQIFIDNTPNGIEKITIPAGITQVTVEVWGGGGGGAASWDNKYSAGGGGGGAYTIAVIDGLVSGQEITYTVGSGGPGGWNTSGLSHPQSGVDGGITTFLSVTAKGGIGGVGISNNSNVASNGGLGGSRETLPSSAISFSGGAGRQGYTTVGSGGGGGSSAGMGNPGTGNTATTDTGAIAPTGSEGGNGGNGYLLVNPPVSRDGKIPGGGGGGGPDSNGQGTGYNGGNGGSGQIRITWSTLDFIGTVNNDYVDFGNNHSLSSNFSLEAWVLQKTKVTKGTIISKGDAKTTSPTNLRGFNLSLIDGKPNLTWYDNVGVEKINIQSPTAIPINKWYHIAATFDATLNKAILYVDGVETIRGTPSAPPTTGAEKFLLGAMYDSGTPTIPKNNFDGYIDEVRVWDVALTAQQIREMMNQEIEVNAGTLKVIGKKIPIDISGEGLTWENLKGYYPMNDNTTNDKSKNGTKHGSPKNMITFQPQTAPLPYKSVAPGGPWDTPATWLNGDVQNPPNSVGINNSSKIDWNIVEAAHNITSGAKDITVLGLISKAGILTIANPIVTTPIENNSGQSLRVTHYLELDGAIDLVGESQLLQDQGSILDQDSGGFIERDQQGTANSYNYNYWSSSVGPISTTTDAKTNRGTGMASTNANYYLGGNLKTEGLMDGTSSGTPVAINFLPSHTAADSGPSSPGRTISTYWLYTFYGADDNYWAWKSVKSTTPILAGEGYTMKGTSGTVAIATMQNYVFKGKPYNGDITLRLDKNITVANPAGDVDRLIGNPYPSALDATKFILDNLSGKHPSGDNIFNGALYFWDHFGLVNSHNLGAYVGGYATRNLTAGAPAISNDIRINNSVGPKTDNTVGKTPGQYIPVNQGFFVITALDASLTGIVTVKGGDIVFKNSQRAYQRESAVTGPSVFMKAGKSKKEIGLNKETTDVRPIIKLMYDSPTGYHRQIVIGKVENTSNHFDLGYDAPIADINKEDMYWTFDGAKFVIQGVPNFDDNQEFPLGLIVSKTGLARIKIDGLENMDKDISLHIKDKLTGESHNISKKPFEIDLAPGTYLDRFALIFKMQKLVEEDVTAEILIPAAAQPIIEGVHVFMNNATGELQIKNNRTEEITSVALINALGQTIKTWNSNFNIRTISLPLSTASGVYLVQINTKTGKTVKKISVE